MPICSCDWNRLKICATFNLPLYNAEVAAIIHPDKKPLYPIHQTLRSVANPFIFLVMFLVHVTMPPIAAINL